MRPKTAPHENDRDSRNEEKMIIKNDKRLKHIWNNVDDDDGLRYY